MRGGRFQFFEGVEVGAFVFCVLPKRVASPKRQGFVFGVVFDHRTMDETDVSPCDDLVEEGFTGSFRPHQPRRRPSFGGLQGSRPSGDA